MSEPYDASVDDVNLTVPMTDRLIVICMVGFNFIPTPETHPLLHERLHVAFYQYRFVTSHLLLCRHEVREEWARDPMRCRIEEVFNDAAPGLTEWTATLAAYFEYCSPEAAKVAAFLEATGGNGMDEQD